MGTRSITWCDFCGATGPVDTVQMTTGRESRSTEAQTKKQDACDRCSKRLQADFTAKVKHDHGPAGAGNL